MSGERYTPPTMVIADSGADPALLREVCAGAEEEGVPVEITPAPPPGHAVELAHEAAGRSRLEVGIGLTGSGDIAVHHATLPAAAPALTVRSANAPDARRAGRTAARIVKHLPLPGPGGAPGACRSPHRRTAGGCCSRSSGGFPGTGCGPCSGPPTG
jgi:hypothetical protein